MCSLRVTNFQRECQSESSDVDRVAIQYNIIKGAAFAKATFKRQDLLDLYLQQLKSSEHLATLLSGIRQESH